MDGKKVRIALDWTANTTHAALLCAESCGFAKEEGGLSFEFVEPTSAHAPATPMDGLLQGTIEIAVSPCDHVLKEHMGQDRVVCVATLTDVDISAVCVLESSGITGCVCPSASSSSSCPCPHENPSRPPAACLSLKQHPSHAPAIAFSLTPRRTQSGKASQCSLRLMWIPPRGRLPRGDD